MLIRRTPTPTLFPYTTLFRSLAFVKTSLLRMLFVALSAVYQKVVHYRNIVSVNIMKSLVRSEEQTSEIQSRGHLVCRLLLGKKTANNTREFPHNTTYEH